LQLKQLEQPAASLEAGQHVQEVDHVEPGDHGAGQLDERF
jgi:hypothetical protein